MKIIRLFLIAAAVVVCSSAIGRAQTTSVGLRSATANLSDTPQTIITVVAPQKFILTDIIVAWGSAAGHEARVFISDGSGVRLTLTPPIQVPFTDKQTFINGLVFTGNVSASCQCDPSPPPDAILTVSGKIVTK